MEIVRRRVKGASETLAVQVADAVSRMRDSDVQKPPGIAEAIDWLAALEPARDRAPRRRGGRPHARLGAQVRRGPGGDPRGRPRAARAQRWLSAGPSAPFGVETIDLDLPPLAGALGQRLRDAGLPVTPERSAEFARALTLVRPQSRRRLYWTARAVFVTDPAAGRAPSTRVFGSVFGDRRAGRAVDARRRPHRAGAADDRPRAERTPLGAASRGERSARERLGRRRRAGEDDADAAEVEVPLAMASDEERAGRRKSFDALEPGRARAALPADVAPRAGDAAAAHAPLRARRATASASTCAGPCAAACAPAAIPIRLARRRRRVVPRRLVMLCDISGSMEPYARRLPAVPRLRGRRRPERRGVRVRHAADAAHAGARLAQPGAGDPARRRRRARLVERNPDRRRAEGVQRPPRPPRDGPRRRGRDPLRRLGARRPGARGARDGAPRAARPPDRLGQPAGQRAAASRCAPAAWSPRCQHCDALVSGHSFEALGEVVDAIGAACPREAARRPGPSRRRPAEEEPWASATPGARQLGGDAERLRAEQGQDDAGMGDR